MRIENFSTENHGMRKRVTAMVVWEDCDRNPQELFYETSCKFEDSISDDPHAFLVGAILPALHFGEQRIAIDAPICAELRNGLLTAIGWFRKWSLFERSICIESSSEVHYPRPLAPRAASFLSGGVDSLAILRANRLAYPADHPNSIKDCLFVHGFDIGGLEGRDEERAAYELALRAVSSIVQDVEATLIPVYTNVRHLYDDLHFWVYQFHGAALASVAHAFSNRLTSVSLASAYKIANLRKKTIHPLLELNYSSANLRIKIEDTRYSRMDRVGLLAQWPAALDNLRVCTMNPPGKLNCGRCEKCLRTMLQLLVFDSLDKAKTFPYQEITPEMLDAIQLTESYQDGWYEELVAPLATRGRHDLIEVIQQKRAAYQKHLAWEEERDWKGAVKRFDRRWLGGSLYTTYSNFLERRRSRS